MLVIFFLIFTGGHNPSHVSGVTLNEYVDTYDD